MPKQLTFSHYLWTIAVFAVLAVAGMASTINFIPSSGYGALLRFLPYIIGASITLLFLPLFLSLEKRKEIPLLSFLLSGLSFALFAALNVVILSRTVPTLLQPLADAPFSRQEMITSKSSSMLGGVFNCEYTLTYMEIPFMYRACTFCVDKIDYYGIDPQSSIKLSGSRNFAGEYVENHRIKPVKGHSEAYADLIVQRLTPGERNQLFQRLQNYRLNYLLAEQNSKPSHDFLQTLERQGPPRASH